jgi:hypothetical protein
MASEIFRNFHGILKTIEPISMILSALRRTINDSYIRSDMRTIRNKAESWAGIVTLSAICALSILAAPRAYADSDNQTCTDSTLDGSYASTISGQIFHSDGTSETRQGLVMMHFDGRGHFTQTDYVLDTLNGTTSLTPGPVNKTGFQNHESGTYQVNRDCTGNLEINFAPPPVPGATGAQLKLVFVLGSHGNAFRTVVVAVTPPSIVPNDITGITLHSEGTRVGNLRDEGSRDGDAAGGPR